MSEVILWGIPLLVLVLRILGRKDPSLLMVSSILCCLYGGFPMAIFVIAEYSGNFVINYTRVVYMAPFFSLMLCLGILGIIKASRPL